MTQHTPGPWNKIKCPCGHPICNSYILDVARADGRLSEEDATLAIAAPDMLEALKAAQEELRLLHMKDTDAVYNPLLSVQMDLAIAKATGAK